MSQMRDCRITRRSAIFRMVVGTDDSKDSKDWKVVEDYKDSSIEGTNGRQ